MKFSGYYIPPEVVKTQSQLDKQGLGEKIIHGKPADIWALGVTIYYISTGKLPFKGEDLYEMK